VRKAANLLEHSADHVIDTETLWAVLCEAHPANAYRDEMLSDKVRLETWLPAYGINRSFLANLDFLTVRRTLDDFALAVKAARGEPLGNGRHLRACKAEYAAQANLIRDLFGNPFRSITIDFVWLAWNNETIPKLAEAIYDERRFADLPILADALEEAGCDNADLLNHCRQPGEHVRGCWVVDRLLGKS
jgi:hypothetical protein